MPEYRTITALLPRIATGTLLILLVGTFISNNDVTGSLNKPMYVGILALGFAITAMFLHSHRSTWLDAVLALLSSGGESFNYVSLATHVQSNALFFPESSPKVTQIQCQYLRSHHSQWMILSPCSVHAYGTGACGIYRPVALQGLILGQLQELR